MMVDKINNWAKLIEILITVTNVRKVMQVISNIMNLQG